MGRKIMPKFVHSAQGVWGLPGPRSLFFENHHNEWISIGLWESADAMEAYNKSEGHAKLMQDMGALIDVGTFKEDVHDADFHYWSPMKHCNWERYPVEVAVWDVKRGFREHCRKLITENKAVAEWAHKQGLLFQVLTYNAAEDKVVAYSVFRDLLKWEAGQGDMEKNIADWGMAEFVVGDHDAGHHMDKHHRTHAHTHHTHTGTIHTNAWVYSE